MKPVVLRVDPYLYTYLYTLKNTAIYKVKKECTDKGRLYDRRNWLVLAELKLVNPHTFIFPKKGKLITLSLAQTVCLQYALQLATVGNTGVHTNVLELITQLDHALTNYSHEHGYKQGKPLHLVP